MDKPTANAALRARTAGLAAALTLLPLAAGAPDKPTGPEPKILLTGVPDSALHFFKMTTTVVHIEPDGQRKTRETFTHWVEVTPKPKPEKDVVTCHRATFRQGNGPELSVPALKGWSYRLPTNANMQDDRGQLFGIDQAIFEKLVDEKGNPLSMNAYPVFNGFVDFHSFCHIFAVKIPGVKGIQDLQRIGDKVSHIGSNQEAPVHLGSLVEKGSTFKNGEITLELKGLSWVDKAPCAIVGYDSGDSSLHMVLKPMPGMNLDMTGGSHYWGDLYIDLASHWVRRATLSELVVSEMSGAMLPSRIHAVVERAIVLESISKEQCEAGR
jgi:hypothetical protein